MIINNAIALIIYCRPSFEVVHVTVVALITVIAIYP